MKKILFLLVVVLATTVFAFKPVKKASSMSLAITHVESIADGNKVYFEIVADVPSPYVPGLLVSTSFKNGRYDWGGNPFPQEMKTVGSITTGYFIDAPIKGSRKRYYQLMDWGADGVLVFSPVFVY